MSLTGYPLSYQVITYTIKENVTALITLNVPRMSRYKSGTTEASRALKKNTPYEEQFKTT